MDLRQGALEVSNQKVSLNFHGALVGRQIDIEIWTNLPQNGASLFGKKKTRKNAWGTIVLSYLVLFIFVYVSREMGINRVIEPEWFQ